MNLFSYGKCGKYDRCINYAIFGLKRQRKKFDCNELCYWKSQVLRYKHTNTHTFTLHYTYFQLFIEWIRCKGVKYFFFKIELDEIMENGSLKKNSNYYWVLFTLPFSQIYKKLNWFKLVKFKCILLGLI